MQTTTRNQIQGGLIFLTFHLLNVVLWSLHPSDVPRRDLVVSFVGLVGLFIVTRTKTTTQEPLQLERTKQFTKLFFVLSMSEVIVTIVLPWALIVQQALSPSSTLAGHVLVPHLFVFQEQIALEAAITTTSRRRQHVLMFQYTCGANLYRGTALATSLGRCVNEASSSHPLLVLLCMLAALLWVCSNAFILLVWYPCLKPIKQQQEGKQA